MDTLDIIDRLEALIKSNKEDSTINSEEVKNDTNQNPLREFINLVLLFFLNILKTPFKLVAKYLTNELIRVVKKDSKLYALIMGLMGVMFVFFTILWFSIAIAVGVYFYDKGNSILISIIYSIIFQIISFSLVGIIVFIASKNIKLLKMVKEISKLEKKN